MEVIISKLTRKALADPVARKLLSKAISWEPGDPEPPLIPIDGKCYRLKFRPSVMVAGPATGEKP